MSTDESPPSEVTSNAPEAAKEPADERLGHSPFPIVGIGASAGGLEACIQLLEHLPDETGMAFVLVQHLDPKYESRLTDLLGKATNMPVQEATHGLAVRPNHVYVIPRNTTLTLAMGTLQVTPRGEGRGPHLPVDQFLRSLAEDSQARAIGVILSGSGSDGTLGLCEIKAVGGTTFAQDEKSARHSGMPRSAIDSGCVDFVLPAEEIAGALVRISRHPYLAPADSAVEELADAEEHFKKILVTVRSATGVDFSHYRDTTIKRRIVRRMMLHTQHTLADYARLLEQDRGEVERLYRDLLINVTRFFREPKLFEALKSTVFPEILKGKSSTTPIRIWVPGCATGQEAYSLAMCLQEFLEDKPVRPPIQIFATDLSDATSLEKARAGVYPETTEAEVSPERLRRFFKKEDHVYRVDKAIRDLCVFARQNVCADPPFSHVDLVSCRNVLIYMAPPLQKRVLPCFHYALNTPGFLVLGAAETVGHFSDLFELVERTHKIYAKKVTAARPYPHFIAEDYSAVSAVPEHKAGARGPTPADFQREADRIVLGRYAPPAVLVNENLDILQYRGRTSPYLEPPPGEPTTSLLKMAREGLFLELRSALMEAKNRNAPVHRQGVRVRSDSQVRDINLEIVPVKPTGAGEGCFLVLFHEAGATPVTLSPSARQEFATPAPRAPWLSRWFGIAHSPSKPEQQGEHLPTSEREVSQLMQELAASKEYMQSLVEQQDATNEELRSANEEVLSSNEELQSTNEELQTAKEELQSTNEELTTVNEQLQHRNLQLNQANDDLLNVLSSTTIPVIVLGPDLCIRRFTAPAKKVMNLLPTDIGRPISDIKPTIEVPDLEVLIADVIEHVQTQEREVRDRDGHWYMLRVHPYRTVDNKIDGAVVVLLDIDQVKRAQEEVLRQAELLRQQASLIELSRDAIIVLDSQRVIIFWNQGAQELYGWSQEEARGKTAHVLLQTDCPLTIAGLCAQLEQVGRWRGELRHTRRDGTQIVVDSQQVLVRDEKGAHSAVLEINRDISERKRSEEQLKHQAEALKQADRRKDEFLAILAHELRNPLASIRNAVDIMRLAGDNPEAMAKARDMLDRQVQQMVRIVEDLLDMTRIVEKKINLRKERIELATVVATAVETMRSFIQACSHELSIRLPQESLYLDADPVRLAQVIANLLNNAAKFTEAGGQIWLSAERANSRDHDAPGEVVISVRDNGIGIAADLMPRIFALFTQGDHSLERKQSGLGIGLALVKSLVEMHGGTIEAHSAGAGQGSEFIVHLPLAAESPHPGPKDREGLREPAVVGRRRILVVDDNQDQTQALATVLELLGHEVRTAYDGPSAVEMAKAFSPEVALVDIGLPGMDGYEVARKIREQPGLEQILLVAETGWGQDTDRQRSLQAGFDHHLVKPVDLDTLQKLLLPGE